MATTADDVLGQVTSLENLGEQVSFLQLGRMRYMVTPVGQDISISEELKAYVQMQVEGIKGQLTNVFEEEIDGHMRKQLDHIQRLRQRGQVAIPSNMQSQVVRYIEQQVCPVKSFIYRPWCIKGTYSDIKGVSELIAPERYLEPDMRAKFARRRNKDGAFSLTFESSIILPGAVALTRTALVIVNELQTNHTYTPSKKLCIGSSDPKQVFALSSEALGTQLSIYNRFSPISSDIVFGSRRYSWPGWLTSQCCNFALTSDSPHGATTLAAVDADDNDDDDDNDDTAQVTLDPAGWRT